MIKLELQITGVPQASRLDVRQVEEAMTDAARAKMRRKGLPRGQNLVGAAEAAKDAAEAEVASQLGLERKAGR